MVNIFREVKGVVTRTILLYQPIDKLEELGFFPYDGGVIGEDEALYIGSREDHDMLLSLITCPEDLEKIADYLKGKFLIYRGPKELNIPLNTPGYCVNTSRKIRH